MKNDLVDVMLASCEGRVGDVEMIWDQRTCVSVVMSSGGYPGPYEKGKEITGLDTVQDMQDTVVFHAGTRAEGNKILTSGGRVLGVTALGKGIEGAVRTAYEAIDKISFDRCFFRRDIGAKGLKYLSKSL